MAKIAILGANGTVGRVAARMLAYMKEISEIRLHDRQQVEVFPVHPSTTISCDMFDVRDIDRLKRFIDGCDLVLNCTGPFYRFAPQILKAAIESHISYVDICDDADATLALLEMDESAKAADLTCIIGMGCSPGLTNLLAKWADDHFLDETESIDIFHIHGGEQSEGEGVVAHRLHCMSIPVPVYMEGELRTVDYFGEDGFSLEQEFCFPLIGKVRLYPYSHPEQLTLPRSIRCRRVTNKGAVLPPAYYQLTRDLCRLGLARQEPLIRIGEHSISPREFSSAYLVRERERILDETWNGPGCGCVSVIVKGKKDQNEHEVRFHLPSQGRGLGEGTGIPAAIGVHLLLQSKISRKGVLTPEESINPLDFFNAAIELLAPVQKTSAIGLTIEQIDSDGNVEVCEL